ncbi:MAG TPA: hypothetical protein VL860_14990, partial [Planctomycetota bacterium]|nr:hypothetical protein [Planctomycetota bacterium]
GLVPKGWTWIDWPGEFEHHKGYLLGERDAGWIARRRAERQPRWDKVDQLWTECHADAARFYAEILEVNPHLIVNGLVEDGMIETGIPTSVALFAETLWNPRRDPGELLRRSQNPYYR